MSSRFNETIARALHSMTVEGLQLFNPIHAKYNSIPTINQDTASKEKILPYASSVLIMKVFETQ